MHRPIADHGSVLDSATRLLILDVLSKALAVASMLVLLYWAAFISRKPRRYCPGQPRPRSAWLWPFTWVTFPQCGYDLTPLPGAAASCRCPECGRTSALPQRRRTPTPVAYRRLGLMLIAAGLLPPLAVYLRSGRWASHAPTAVLLAVRATMGTHTQWAVRSSIYQRCQPPHDNAGNRIDDPPLPQWQQRWAVRLFIDDMRDDDVRDNADSARYALSCLPTTLTVAPLQAALNDPDQQLRQFAADILRANRSLPVSDDLLRVSVESLRDDRPGPDGRWSWLQMSNAAGGFDFLLTHAQRAEPFIAAGINGGDPQQRFLASVIAATTRLERLLPSACPQLIEALGSDDIAENAKFAAAAFLKLGPAALLYLEPARRDDDAQRRQVACLLVERIIEPRGPATRLLPSDAASISQLAAEPSLLKIENLERRFYDFPSIKTPSR
ncbi:MAG: hypothetical protein Q8L55_07575 [Phycisphaerales bacterium]|nr:hypothetical protein [Phycisphaerales bacterium]